MSFAYSVAIKLSVANLASQGIRLLATDLLAAHGAAAKLEDKLKALKLVAVGYGLEKIGSGMLGFLEKSVDASKEYTRQLSLMNAAGMTQREIAEAAAAAWKTSKEVITSSVSENLTAIRELRSVFGKDHMHEAYGILPTVQRTKAILEALTGKQQHGVAFDMVKAIELRTPGTMSAERMQSNADMMAKTLMAMGGTLNVNDFHMALKQAKTSAFGLSDEFVYKYLPTFMQEVKTKEGGAQSAGTALMTTYQALIGGKLKKSAIPLWESMGLINPGDVVRNSTGQMQLKPGAVKDSALFQANPYEWANKVLAPAIEAYGKKTGLNREQVLSGMFGDRNAQWMMNTLIGKAGQFERDRALVDSGLSGYDTYQKLLKSNPQLAQQALHAQWENVQARLGYEVLPRLIPYMLKFADGLDSIAQWMEKHGTATTAIALGLGAVGIGLTLIGKVLMTAGIIKFLGLGPVISGMLARVGSGIMSFIGIVGRGFGLLARGALFLGRALLMNPIGLVITAIAAAAYLLWKNWDYVGPKLQAAWDSIKSAVGALADWMRAKWEWIKSYLPSSWFSDSKGSGGTVAQPAAAAQPTGGSPYVAPKADQPVQVTTQINMDGRKVAEAVSQHQAKAASRPFSGSASFDYGMAAPPVGMGYAR
ncbi:MAG: hypothetical protein VB138_01515 [Burkholderia sp.]